MRWRGGVGDQERMMAEDHGNGPTSTGRDNTGRDNTGCDNTGRDNLGRDNPGRDDGEGRMRRVFGGRASRLEVYLLAAAMFVFAAGGIGGAVVLTANETTTVVMEGSTITSTSLDPSTTTSVPVPDTPPAEPTPPPTFAPPVTVLIPAPPQFTEQELATLQAQAQKGIAEQAAHDAWIRSLSIDGCPPGPYEQILVGWNGGVRDPAMTVSGAANSTNFVQLGVEVSRVANLGCVSVGLSGNGEPAGTWEVGWFNTGLFTAEHVRTALRNLGYL